MRLVVVTKGQPLQVVEAAVQAGARILGENYAEEATAKIDALHSSSIDAGGVQWHMIGHVQARKAKLVAPHFDLIHSVDSLKLARKLDALAAELGRPISVLLECNVGGETGKHGWDAANQAKWSELLGEIQAVGALSHLNIRGLMTMPPLAAEPEDSRRFFRLLRRIAGLSRQERFRSRLERAFHGDQRRLHRRGGGGRHPGAHW